MQCKTTYISNKKLPAFELIYLVPYSFRWSD